MVVVMKERASDAQVESVIAHLVELGMDVHRSSGASRVVLGVVGTGKVDPRLIEMLEGKLERTFLVLNKVDTVSSKTELLPTLDKLASRPFAVPRPPRWAWQSMP